MNTQITTEFCPNLTVIDGQIKTTSLKVAEHFNKQHKNVLRAIQSLDCSPEFNRLNFELVEYEDAKGEKQPAYEITRDGFMFLAMGFTGAKAAQWKEAYITAFNRMESELQGKPQPALTMPQVQPNSVTLTLGENSKPKRYLVTQGESDLTVIRALPDDALVGTCEQVIRDLHADGYIVIKKDSVSMQKMVMDYIPAQYLTDLIEAAASRLKRISHKE